MATGIFVTACVWLMLGQNPDGVTYLNYRQVEVPVVVDPAQQAGIREILLYASDDQGRSWELSGRITPEKRHFAFFAKGDGLYWLRVVQVDRNGVQNPDDMAIKKGPPDMKIVVDTLKPIVRSFQAQRYEDEIYVNWELQEDNLDAKNLRLEYQIKGSLPEAWKAVTIQPALRGQTRFTPGHKQPLTLRLVVRDLAKNESYSTAEVAGTIVTTGYTSGAPGVDSAVPKDVMPPKTAIDVNKGVIAPLGGKEKEIAPPVPIGDMRPVLPAPPGGPNALVPPPPIGIQNDADKALFTKPMNFGSAPVTNPTPAPITNPSPAPIKETPTEKVIADSSLPPPAPVVAPKGGLTGVQSKEMPSDVKPVANAVPAKKALPALQFINQHQVMLEYELKRVGPSGIGGIEVWLTRDDGDTWEPFAADEDVQSGAINRRQQRKFDLRDANDRPFADGIYGMSLVVKNRAGMGKKPRPGDAPELRVEIDTQLPDAQLFMPVADPQNPDHVLLKWSAKDKNLADRPIHLEYAVRPDGEWLPIKLDLENNGRYTSERVTGDFSWKVPANTPVQVYLRLRVRDKAGNERVLVTPQPQFVDLTEPEGNLIGVQPNTKGP